ncbi:MAG: hypothetical protein ACT4NU_03190 [Chromatiales bacterium]
MTKQSRALLISGALLLGAMAPLASMGVQVAMEMDKMEQMITTASTETDHEALAAQYESEAKSLLEMAEHHKAMAKAYESLATGGFKGGAAAFVAHCKRLVAKYEEAAAEYTQLAMLHHQLAAEMTASKTRGATTKGTT